MLLAGKVRHLLRRKPVSPLWQEHVLPLFLYALLSIGLTWPTVLRFTTHLPGESNDVQTMVWIMWHVKEAVLGRLPLIDLPLLYYPAGASLLTSAPGPLIGFIALPFWPWGPEAAYNGFLLLGFVFTAYPMYLLARALELGRPVAFFAGLFYLLAPMHLAGVLGHPTKVFLGLLPLALLCLHRLFNAADSRPRVLLWAAATALVALLSLLFYGLHFILIMLSIPFFAALSFWREKGRARLWIGPRLAILGLFILVAAGPLLLAISQAAFDPTLDFDRNLDVYQFQPDLAEFFLPPAKSRLFGDLTTASLGRINWVQGIETTVSLSWVALALTAVALLQARRRAGPWLLFGGLWFVLALGPSLKVLGRTTFTEYGLPVILPYAFFTSLPGLGFLRTSGRLMQMGYIGFGLAAAIGLSWLVQRFPRRALLIVALAVALLLLENWPTPWPQMELLSAPTFYRQLAADEERYGVLDLPLTSRPEIPTVLHFANYQIFQMTHRKGIASGYISRVAERHPVFPCLFDGMPTLPDILVNGAPSSCSFHPAYDLPRANYRYVVRHKPWAAYIPQEGSPWDESATDRFIARFFGDQEPLQEDEEVVVYALPRQADPTVLQTTLAPAANWHELEDDGESSWRWAQSPAELAVSSPRRTEAVLEIVPHIVYEPEGRQVTGANGRLQVALEGELLATVPIAPGEAVMIPLTLSPGVQMLTLTLEAGNFRPTDHGGADARLLSFAVRQLNLRTVD